MNNLRRNSENGRAIMMKDLEVMHEKLLKAYKAVMLVSGVDLEKARRRAERFAASNGTPANIRWPLPTLPYNRRWALLSERI
jgi:hypothetical protein